MGKADLHVHTSASDDASLDPEWVFRYAGETGLAALAFADHDGIALVEEGRRLSETYELPFLPATEISSSWRGQLAHVLGYFPHGIVASFERFLAERVWSERRRVQLLLLERLQQQGAAITREEYEAEVCAGRSGTYHLPLCRLLLRKGIVSSVKAYAALRKAANLDCLYPTIAEVIQAVHDARGLAVLAHPGVEEGEFHRFDGRDVATIAGIGLDGLEVFHHAHDEERTRCYTRLADRLGLIKTGGSDCHHQHGRAPGSWFCDWDDVLRYLDEPERI